MTIIEFMRQKLTEYPKISEFMVDEIHVDFTEPDLNGYGLSSHGDLLLREDLLGNQTRQHTFILYAVGRFFNDYARLTNSNFLLELGYWLEQLPAEPGIEVVTGSETRAAIFLKARTANAMAMQPIGETVSDGVLYQIQIHAQYQVESEELF